MRVVDLSDREINTGILESCRSGDREAFRALYDAYKDRVFSIALYFFHGDRSLASDVTQEVFLKLMTNVGQFRGEAEFSTWLYRLVVNACTDTARRRKSEVDAADRFGRASASEAPQPGFQPQEDAYARAQIAGAVRLAISALPPKFRIAVLLRYFDDLSYGQMAAALNCSMGTVASRLSRGHRMLADRLQQLRPGKA